MNELQQAEIAKYERAYKLEGYRMSPARRTAVERALARRPDLRWSLLDVGTGRGETLEIAQAVGYRLVAGTEVVPYLLQPGVVQAVAWALPFAPAAFKVVTCFDVMEHLLAADAEPTIRELGRVARRRIILTISNLPSSMGDEELHVNRRPYEDWDRDLRAWLPGWSVEWLPLESSGISEMWEATR